MAARRIYVLDGDSGERRPLPMRRSGVDTALAWLARAAAPLGSTSFRGRLDRRALGHAILIAVAIVTVARGVDWMMFSAMPGVAPAFFVSVAGICLAPSLCAAVVRRLHDARCSGWWMLLIVVPVVGWAFLAGLLSRRG